MRLVLRISKAMLLFLRDKISDDIILIAQHGRLFFGMLLAGVGVLSFASDRYCDGNASSYYACTRPATYYYFPWWAIVLIITGIVFITLWYLRKKK